MNALYEKVGKRYKPVRFGVEFDYFSPGFHLIHVEKGGQSWMLNIDPSKVRIKSYVKENFEKAIYEVVKKECELRPSKQKFTKKQIKLWSQAKEILGDEFDYLQYSSIQGIVDVVLNKVEELIEQDKNRLK